MSIDTNDNRFHALKFAVATNGVEGWQVLHLAEEYLRFLDGKPEADRAAAVIGGLNADDRKAALLAALSPAASVCPDPSNFLEGARFCGSDGQIYVIRSGAWAIEGKSAEDDIELSDLTESYPADEPVIAMADSPVEEELFEREAEPSAELIEVVVSGEVPDPLLVGTVTAEGEWKIDQEAVSRALNAPSYAYGSSVIIGEDAETLQAFEAAQNTPTEAEITAAVEQIADPAPASEDASEQPEMTDEQVERTEDHWRAAADQIGAAEHEPEKELEPVGVHMRFAPWFATRK